MERKSFAAALVGLGVMVAGCGADGPPHVPADQLLVGTWEHVYNSPGSTRTAWRLDLMSGNRFSRTFESRPAPSGPTVSGSWNASEPKVERSWRQRLGLSEAAVTVPLITLTLEYSVPQGTELPAGATVVRHEGGATAALGAPGPGALQVRETYLARVRTNEGRTELTLLTPDSLQDATGGATRSSRPGPLHLSPQGDFVKIR